MQAALGQLSLERGEVVFDGLAGVEPVELSLQRVAGRQSRQLQEARLDQLGNSGTASALERPT